MGFAPIPTACSLQTLILHFSYDFQRGALGFPEPGGTFLNRALMEDTCLICFAVCVWFPLGRERLGSSREDSLPSLGCAGEQKEQPDPWGGEGLWGQVMLGWVRCCSCCQGTERGFIWRIRAAEGRRLQGWREEPALQR